MTISKGWIVRRLFFVPLEGVHGPLRGQFGLPKGVVDCSLSVVLDVGPKSHGNIGVAHLLLYERKRDASTDHRCCVPVSKAVRRQMDSNLRPSTSQGLSNARRLRGIS